jgi:tetratricopeptide (TPR) repeat protein
MERHVAGVACFQSEHAMAKYTKEDVLCVVNAMRQRERHGGFALLTGAGCSITAGIPLAPKLVEECQKTYPDVFNSTKPIDYGECMGMLSLDEREAIIGPYLDRQKLNWAHIAIATLIEKKWISRVMTFNFDSVLARACGLLGRYPATYDFGIAVTSNTDYLAKTCIIHLHGQGFGPVQMNSGEETKVHADGLRPLLQNTFENYPLVVLGYSGESDKVFDVLKEAYKRRHRIYWLGYEEEPKPHICALMAANPHVIHYFGGADADEFMIAVAQEAGCFPPKVFADPAAHLLDEMEYVVEFPLAKTTMKFDLLKDTRARLQQHGAQLQLGALSSRALSGNNDDILRSETTGVTKGVVGGVNEELSRKLSAWAHFNRGTELAVKASQTQSIADYEACLPDLEQAVVLNPQFYEALYNWGNAILDLAKLKGDEALFQQSFAKYEAALVIKPELHEALYNWGNALSDLAELKDDKSLFEQSVAKYEAALMIKPDDHQALYNCGNSLFALARLKGGEAFFEQAFAKYKAALEIKPDKDEVLTAWGTALSELANLKGDEALFEQAFVKYKAVLAIKPDLHETLDSWGAALLHLWRSSKDPALLVQAAEKLDLHDKLNPKKPYNSACLAAIRSDEERCHTLLVKAKEYGSLPSAKHLMEDLDLEPMRDKLWFQELVAGA